MWINLRNNLLLIFQDSLYMKIHYYLSKIGFFYKRILVQKVKDIDKEIFRKINYKFSTLRIKDLETKLNRVSGVYDIKISIKYLIFSYSWSAIS